MEQGKKKLIIQIVILVVVAAAILGVFLYLSKRPNNSIKEPPKTEVWLILDKDIDRLYPATPREVMKLYCRVLKCFQNEKLTEDETKLLAAFQQKMFDEELIAANPLPEYYNIIKNDMTGAEKLSADIATYKVELDSGIDKWVSGENSFAKVVVCYKMKYGGSYETFYEEYLLRLDGNNRYKVVGWRETDGKDAIIE